jgi:hypothetical protein
MWETVVAALIWSVSPLGPPVIADRPYVSCVDGHIVATLDQCPPMPPRGGAGNRSTGGVPIGGGGSGLLGLGIGGIL